jgi:quercetin dioxygenase-like cupin family protein
VLVAAEGSITFELAATGERITLAAGDRLELPAGTSHAAVAGGAGVRCLEAHLPAGSLSGGVRHEPAWGGRGVAADAETARPGAA